jgi:hypothetical protein
MRLHIRAVAFRFHQGDSMATTTKNAKATKTEAKTAEWEDVENRRDRFGSELDALCNQCAPDLMALGIDHADAADMVLERLERVQRLDSMVQADEVS